MAENISAAIAWQLADAVRSMTKGKTGPSTGTATFVGTDSTGRALVLLPGADQPTPVHGAISANAEVGSTVTYSLANGQLSITGNASDPAVGEAKATEIADTATRPIATAQRAIGAMADAAKRVAEDASAVASATRQHFWTDDSGVHVTDDEGSAWQEEYAKAGHGSLENPTDQRPWHNVLVNSLGILLRRGLRNLVSITHGAVAFYDGAGNEASNVTASFGATGAQIGKDNARHAVVDSDGLTVYNADGTIAPVNATVDGANIVDASIVGGKIQGATLTDIPYAAISDADIEVARVADAEISSATITQAQVKDLSVDYARANLANVNNAWIENGTIRDAAIGDAQIIGVSANKLTAGTIDAAEINVMNLRADNLKVSRVNGQPVIGGYALVDPSSSGYAGKNPKAQGWYELTSSGYALTNDTSVVSGKAYYTTSTSVELYDQTYIDGLADDLNDRIDGAIETFTGTVVPTLNNTPASAWTTTKLRDEHVGDVYYVVNSQSQQNGYCYRFTKSGSTYSWQLIKDSDVTAALSRLQTAEGKITTFDSDISTLKTDTGELKTKTQSLETSLGDKVDVTTFNELSSDVEENSASITTLSNTVSQKADSSTVTTLSNTVNTVKQTADANKTSITNLTKTVSDNKTAIETRASTIEQNLSGITTRVGKTEAELDTVSNPNLSPFFSVEPSDYYDASSNPDGYWNESKSPYVTKLSDGWVHYEHNNTGSNTFWLTIYEHSAWRHAHGDLKGSTKYTVMIEFRNVTKSGNVTCIGTCTHASSWPSMFVGNSDKGNVAVANGVQYHIGTTVTDPSSVTGSTCTTRTLITIPAGASIDCDMRVSLYEGEYSGPYKPYVDQTLSNRVKSAETSIEQNSEAIALRATKADVQSLGGNLLTDTDNPVLGSNIAPKYSVVSGGNGTGTIATVTDSPLPNFKKSFRITENTSGNRDFAQSVGIVYSQKYLFTTYARGIGGNATALVRVFSGSELFTYTTVVGTDWTPIRTIVTLTGAGSAAYYFFQFGLTGAGSIEYIAPCLSGGAAANTAAELKVANDNINLKVSKNDVINQINVSTEGAKIQASRVEIDGTAVFNAAKSKLDAAYDAKGAAATVQTNLDNLEIGGRNLLLATPTSYKQTSYDAYVIPSSTSAKELGAGTTLTIQFWDVVLDANSSGIGGYWGGGSSGNLFLIKPDSDGYCSKTFTIPTGTASHAQGANKWLCLYNIPNGHSGISLSIGRWKLEKGNKPTDWSVAPEDTVKRTQRIWYRTNGSSAPATPGTASSNWVTKADDGNDAWTKMHIAISSTHKYIYTCEQYEMANGTVGYTSVLLDNTITVIDGGNIITGSVTANEVNFADATGNQLKLFDPSNPTSYQIISGSGNEVFVGGESVARFGEVVRIGRASAVRTEIAPGTFTILDPSGAYLMRFYSRNTNSDGSATVSMSSTGNGSTRTFTPVYAPSEVVSAAYTDGTDLETPTISGKAFVFETAPATKAFTVTYRTLEPVYYASLGTRLASDSQGTYAAGNASVALGRLNAATTQGATAIGRNNKSTATDAYTLGRANVASAMYAFAMGNTSTASANSAIAIGNAAEASATDATAIGNGAYAGGTGAIALGNNATAIASNAYALGRYVSAESADQMVIGRYNEADDADKYSFVIGNGSSASSLHNALAVDSTTGLVRSWNKSTGESGFVAQREGTGVEVHFIVGSGGVNHGVWSTPLNRWIIHATTTDIYIGNASITNVAEHRFFAAPSGGGEAGFRAIWASDIPDLAASKITSGTFNAARIPTLAASKVSATDPVSITLNSATNAYSSGMTPKYRKWGDVVNVYGAVSPKSEVAAGGTLTIGTLPSGYRPSIDSDWLCQGSGNAVWLLTIDSNGTMTASRYRSGASANAAMSTSAWLVFNVTYIVS